MNSRNIVNLFISTLVIGGVAAGLAGFVFRWDQFQPLFSSFDIGEIIISFIWMIGVGLIFSVLSQAGFFAYLTVHRFGLGIFKSVSLWNSVQVLLIIFVLFDLVYLRYINFASKGDALFPYVAVAIMLLVIGLITAYFKAKQTNKHAFIPALFFMTVITTLEWTPVLRADDISWMYFMFIPLIVCNIYQLLILDKLIRKSKVELEARRAEKAAISKSKGKNKVQKLKEV
ncbi:KinB-signaling pathway activation protein [Peribacillus psychrosaccharolyticus]|uniref:KinB-signaling pathway activation protein n=1 Tax=Peribacillus psychrosaccharolyticus TaxID=1407 RepID=UPI003D27032C